MTIKKGDRVQVLCATRLENGDWLDDEDERQTPMWLQAGSQLKLQSVSEGLIGMRIGEKQTFEITPDKGFGYRNPAKVIRINSSDLPSDIRVGDEISFKTAKSKSSGVVQSLHPKFVVVDTNHPFSGKTLFIDVEVLQIM